MTQKALADAIHVSCKHISNIETGNATVSLPTLLDIVNALAVSADTLLCDSVVNAKNIYIKKISMLLEECNSYEARFLEENLTQTLKSFRTLEDMRRKHGS